MPCFPEIFIGLKMPFHQTGYQPANMPERWLDRVPGFIIDGV